MESLHEGGDSEVVFKEEEQEIGDSTPPTPITTCDMEVIIRGWEEKFERILQCLREVQSASERANSDMCLISREARAQGDEQERRLEAMHAGLTEFLQNVTPRTSQLRTTWTLPRRARHTHLQEYQPDCARNLDSSHRQWARTSPWNLRAARCRTSGVRAPGITTTFGKRASGNTRFSGTRAPGITTTFGTRASENTTLSGTRAPGIRTTFGTRAPGNTSIIGTRAPETCMIDSTNYPHTKMTGGIAVTYNGFLITLA